MLHALSAGDFSQLVTDQDIHDAERILGGKFPELKITKDEARMYHMVLRNRRILQNKWLIKLLQEAKKGKDTTLENLVQLNPPPPALEQPDWQLWRQKAAIGQPKEEEANNGT